MHSSVDPSPHPNCYHPIFFSKFNLKICYHSPYKLLVWPYQYANIDLISDEKSTYLIWKKLFKQVSLFNETVTGISEKWDPRPGIFCWTRDPEPETRHHQSELKPEIRDPTYWGNLGLERKNAIPNTLSTRLTQDPYDRRDPSPKTNISCRSCEGRTTV